MRVRPLFEIALICFRLERSHSTLRIAAWLIPTDGFADQRFCIVHRSPGGVVEPGRCGSLILLCERFMPCRLDEMKLPRCDAEISFHQGGRPASMFARIFSRGGRPLVKGKAPFHEMEVPNRCGEVSFQGGTVSFHDAKRSPSWRGKSEPCFEAKNAGWGKKRDQRGFTFSEVGAATRGGAPRYGWVVGVFPPIRSSTCTASASR